ncbi:PQQ-binding-like beta-propeller repeat protein [bacterium]|nr:PQQ-binding-like beta-propeller repeat protein [bacterium]
MSPATEVQLETALADVEALQAGNEVDEAVLDELKRELSRLLNENSPDGKHVAATQETAQRQIELDFSLGRLSWYGVIRGDYDMNGEVNAADLRPIGKNFGASGDFVPGELLYFVDGNGDGTINISDVADIGRFYGMQISGWNLYAGASPDDHPQNGVGSNGPSASLLKTIDYFSHAGGGYPIRFEYLFRSEYEPGSTYWLRPTDGQKEGRASTAVNAPESITGLGGWCMQGGNPQRSRLSPHPGPRSGSLRWTRRHDQRLAEVSFAADGTAYVQPVDGNLLAIDPLGNELWSSDLVQGAYFPPSVDIDGTLYSSDGIRKLIGINPDGSEKFIYNGDNYGQTFDAPLLAADGLVYVRNSDTNTYGFTRSGELDWVFESDRSFGSGPSCSLSGSVFVGQGKSFWRIQREQPVFTGFYPLGYEVLEAPVFASDGNVYTGSWETGTFTAITAYPGARWTVENKGGSATPPAIADDGTLLFGTGTVDGNGYIKAYTPSGEELWSYEAGAAVHYAPAVDSDGYIYAASNAGRIFSLSPAGELAWTYDEAPASEFQLSLSPGGMLYAAGWDGSLLVFGERIAPRDFTASDGTYQEEVHLQWTGLPDASGYGIEYRSADGNGPPDWTALYETAGPDATQFSHTLDAPAGNEAAFGNQYDYRVRALYAGADPGPWSDSDSGSLQESWTRWGHDLRNSNQALVDGPDSSHRRWGYSGVTFAHCSPVVAGDGTVYVGSFDSFLYALNPDGSLKWRYQTGDKIGSTAAIGRDGTIYFGSYDGRLYALNPDGKEIWSRGYGNSISSSPVIARNGNIIFTDRGDHVNAMSPEGDYLWSVDATAIIKGAPAVGGDDTIYIGGHDGMLTAISPAGAVKWVFDAPGQIINPPCLGKNGNIYFTCNGGLFALSPSGGKLWEYDGPGIGSYDTLAIDTADNVCLLNGGEFSRISPAGSLLDQLQLTGAPLEPVSLDAAGRIYMGTSTGYIKAFNPDGSEAWQFDMEGECYATPTIGPDGTLYVGSKRGYLYAFGS